MMVELAASEHPPRRRRRWPWLLVIMAAAVATASVLSTGFGRDPSVVPSVLIDEPAPPLAGPTLEGGHFDLADHDGRVVVVNVWASWCAPCREEHPELEAAAADLAAYDVQFVGINTQDTVSAATAFLEEMGGSAYPSVLDPEGRMTVDWGVFGVPETFVVDQHGRIRTKVTGKVTAEWLRSQVAQLLTHSSEP